MRKEKGKGKEKNEKGKGKGKAGLLSAPLRLPAGCG